MLELKNKFTWQIVVGHFAITGFVATIGWFATGFSFWVCLIMAEISVLANGWITVLGRNGKSEK